MHAHSHALMCMCTHMHARSHMSYTHTHRHMQQTCTIRVPPDSCQPTQTHTHTPACPGWSPSLSVSLRTTTPRLPACLCELPPQAILASGGPALVLVHVPHRVFPQVNLSPGGLTFALVHALHRVFPQVGPPPGGPAFVLMHIPVVFFTASGIPGEVDERLDTAEGIMAAGLRSIGMASAQVGLGTRVRVLLLLMCLSA